MKKNLTYLEIYQKFKLVLGNENKFFVAVFIYGTSISLLMLTFPISVQALISTVTFGVTLQPLIVLAIILMGLLLFSSFLNALQTYTIECFQQHFYARTTSNIVRRILNSSSKVIEQKNATDLVNRYFDIVTIQKSMTSLLTGGVSLVMQTFTGMILLAFYHPYFLAFDIILVICLYFIWHIYASRGFSTSVEESYAKYEMGSTLDEIVKLQSFSKSEIRRKEVIQRADAGIKKFIVKRKKHFFIFFQQNILLLLLYAIMSAFILGLAGYLVMAQELSLGQLVAAELVVTAILASFTKAHEYIEKLYDLYASSDKISAFYDLMEEKNINYAQHNLQKCDLNFKQVVLKSTDKSYHFNFSFEHGKKYLIKSSHYTHNALFLELLQSINQPSSGAIFLGPHNLNELALPQVRDYIYATNKAYLIEDTIEGNLRFGNPEYTRVKAREALKICELDLIEDHFKDGFETKILSCGHPLWNSQVIRLELARMLLSNSPILVISKLLDQVDPHRRMKFLKAIFETDKMLILISNDEYPDLKFDHYLHFTDSVLIETTPDGRRIN